jgi:hypothetical protein
MKRFFHVFISVPKDGEKQPYRQNKTLGIVALSLQDAVVEAEKHYPTCTVWSVSHRGVVDHVIEYLDGHHNEDKAWANRELTAHSFGN